jgi:hypothetical protein
VNPHLARKVKEGFAVRRGRRGAGQTEPGASWRPSLC